MEKSLRLVSINFPFLASPVEDLRSFATRQARSDYDVVVIRPHPLTWFLKHPASRVGGESWVEAGDFAKVEAIVSRTKSGILRLLERGGLLVVILDSIEVLKWNPNAAGQSHLAGARRISNYDFLDEQFHSCVGNGSGKDIRLVDTSTPFAKVIQNSLVHWTASLERRPTCPYDNPRIFARNAPDSVLGAVFEFRRTLLGCVRRAVQGDPRLGDHSRGNPLPLRLRGPAPFLRSPPFQISRSPAQLMRRVENGFRTIGRRDVECWRRDHTSTGTSLFLQGGSVPDVLRLGVKTEGEQRKTAPPRSESPPRL